MKLRHILFITLVCAITAFAENPPKFSRIKIFVPDKTALDRIWNTGIDYEGVSGKIGGWMEFVAGPHEREQLDQQNIPYEIVIDDLAKYYEQQLSPVPLDIFGFGYGSMGGFYTFNEVVLQLDTMRLQYPNLITAKQSIGLSIQSRNLWAVKISDNPNVDEDEPEVLYTALHHAREPASMMTLIYYMWWLLENYGTNPDATYLVNNREMWFIPVVNPDGYVHNQTTNPNGGGMWRKNRRNNGDGSFGVDLNRNYGPYYMWNSPNGGSSTIPSSETYRGTAPFSEPECQAIDYFMRARTIKSCFNYHTYSNLLIYPWGYLSRENGDSLIYRDWAYYMTAHNHYMMGTDLQTVNYATRGNSDDYMYGDTTKPVTYTMTPEVGITGFWPTQSEILPLAQENLVANILLAYFAGPYPSLIGSTVQDNGGNGFFDVNESFLLHLTFKNKGLTKAVNPTISVSTNSPHIQFSSPQQTLDSITVQGTTQVTFAGEVLPSATGSTPFQVYVSVTDPQGFQKLDTLNYYIGTPTIIFADSASSGTANWNTGQGWGTTSNAHTPPFSFTDSPTGAYAANANNSLTLNNQLSLSGFQYAQLKFWTKWAIEPTWDFAVVEISTNNGSTWTTLRTELSNAGSARSGSVQPSGTWGYDAYTPGLTWVEQQVDLTSYVNRQIRIRFRVVADGSDQRDGFYVDDIRVFGYFTAPAQPILASPANGSTNQPRRPTLVWRTSANATSYHLQVAADSIFSAIVFSDSTLIDTLKMITPLHYNTTYYWRVCAKKNGISSPYSETWNFTTTMMPPPTPFLASPPNNAFHLPDSVTLVWRQSPTSTRYRLQLATDQLFAAIILDDSTLVDTTKEVSGLSLNTTYYWHVRAENDGGSSPYSETWRFTTLLDPPSIPLLASPPDGAIQQSILLRLRWNEANLAFAYHLQLSEDSTFMTTLVNDSTIEGTSYSTPLLTDNVMYFWRVKALNFASSSNWSTVWRFTTGVETTTVAIYQRWNIVSLPPLVSNRSVNAIFPAATTNPFAFVPGGGYVQRDTLSYGEGCWLKFPSSTNLQIVGHSRLTDTIDLQLGWNLIGTISTAIATEKVIEIPPGILSSRFFGYNAGYSEATILEPGKGYWVKANQNGQIILDAEFSASHYTGILTARTSHRLENYNSLTVQDMTGAQTTLYFTTLQQEHRLQFPAELPPIPPAGAFDARFASNSFVEQLSEKNPKAAILIQSPSYPITVAWKVNGELRHPFQLTDAMGKTLAGNSVLKENGKLTLHDESITLLYLELYTEPPMPKEFILLQNYPNPFNPTTTIEFGLPTASKVTIKLFNILGEEVQTIIAQRQYDEGHHSVFFDASRLSSGIYFYKMVTQPAKGGLVFRETKKMMILK